MKSSSILLSICALAFTGLAWWWGNRAATPTTHEVARPKKEEQKPNQTPGETVKTATHQPQENATEKAAATAPLAPTTSADVGRQCDAILATDGTAKRLLDFAKLVASTHDEAGLRAILASFLARYKAGKRNSEEWGTFWSEMVSRDPRMAAALIDSYGDEPKWQAGGLAMVAYEWAKKDPQAVIDWLTSHTNLTDHAFDAATVNLIAGYADKDASAAAVYALSVIKKGDKLWGDTSWVLTNAAMQAGGAKGLQRWYDSLPDDVARERLFYSVAQRMGRESLETQVQWLTTQATNAQRDDRSYRETAATWAETDPAAALTWVFNLPPSAKENGIVGVGYAAFPWLVKDVAGFTQHYQTLPQAQQQEIAKVVRIVVNDPKNTAEKRDAGAVFLKNIGQH
jgi:hypothetical protein